MIIVRIHQTKRCYSYCARQDNILMNENSFRCNYNAIRSIKRFNYVLVFIVVFAYKRRQAKFDNRVETRDVVYKKSLIIILAQ